MNNGINFSMDGPMIDGTWQNMETGDYFEVRDSFFQDGQLIVQATDGRMLDYNMLQDYIKVDKPEQTAKQKAKKNKTLPKELEQEIETTDSVENETGMLDDDLALISGKPQTPMVSAGVTNVAFTNPASVEDEDAKLINRVLTRAKTVPEFKQSVTWKNFPIKQMEMLVDYMGVPVEKISHYYIDKMTIEEIKEILLNLLNDYIEAGLNEPEQKPEKEQKQKKPK